MVKIGTKRAGICRHIDEMVEQVYDGVSNDAPDQKGWLCLHREEVM